VILTSTPPLLVQPQAARVGVKPHPIGHVAGTPGRELVQEGAHARPDYHKDKHRGGADEEHRDHRSVDMRPGQAPALGDGPPRRIVGSAVAEGSDTTGDVRTAAAAVGSSPATPRPSG
jgi:hypothetical protein